MPSLVPSRTSPATTPARTTTTTTASSSPPNLRGAAPGSLLSRSNSTGSGMSDQTSQQQQQRSKHIEVCVRLRPLVIEAGTSSSSFFHAQPHRKPAIPKPSYRTNNNNSHAGIHPSKSGSPKQPLSPESGAESLENGTESPPFPAAAYCYAWDVVDTDTVAQNATATELVLGRTHSYTLDRVYGPSSSTQTVYQQSVQDLVRAAMDGYHTAVLAYGQTATGKTHTMTGTVDEPGFIPLSVRECFHHLQTVGRTGEYLLRVSYLEVYKEHIKDLLSSSTVVQPIRLFESEGQLQIRGLKEVVVTSPEQVFSILAEGEARRQVGATHLNQHSSRSHVMVRLWIESRTVVQEREIIRVSSLSLVDLAGSESVRLTGSSERRAEGHYINKSLMTLGQVVYALSEGEKDGSLKKHIPYRDSKLTRLLQPSLSGNAQVVLLCCISPLATHIEESHNTFKFAVRAKKVPQKAVLQEQSATDETILLQSYRAEIEDLKQQLREAQEAQRLQLLSQLNSNNISSEETEEKEMQELVEAILTMEKLILKTRPVASDDENLLDASESGDFYFSSNAVAQGDVKLHAIFKSSKNDDTAPSTPSDRKVKNGSLRHHKIRSSSGDGDVLQSELSRIQGLLGSVLKKRLSGAAVAAPAISEEEVRSLRAALEQQEVATSLRQADSSFLQAQLEEKDNLLAEVSKLLEAVEERQGQLEAENLRLRQELEDLRALEL